MPWGAGRLVSGAGTLPLVGPGGKRRIAGFRPAWSGPGLLGGVGLGMLCTVVEPWLRQRLWPGAAELGMAFAGLVVGWLTVGLTLSLAGSGPWTLAGGPAIVGVAGLFYWKVAPQWSRAASEPDAELPADSPLPAVGPWRAVVSVAWGIVAALVGSIAIGYLLEALGAHVQEQDTVMKIVEGSERALTAEAAVLAVSALVLAPLAEEWLFRGLLFRRVRTRSGRLLAYVLSALGFAAIHGNPAGFVIYLWLGLVFAATYERTGWLGAAMAVHMGNNAYVLAVLFGLVGGGPA